jgi:AraC-like DNA-binding protein
MWQNSSQIAPSLHEIGHAATRPISVPSCNDARLRRVTEALLANPADPRTLDAFAEMAGASARTLARLFRRETGMSFQAWRRQLRLTEGLAALSEGETPARVAAAVGYVMLEKRSAGVAKLLIDATAALGRKGRGAVWR